MKLSIWLSGKAGGGDIVSYGNDEQRCMAGKWAISYSHYLRERTLEQRVLADATRHQSTFELDQGLLLDLPHAFAGDAHFRRQLFQRGWIVVVETETTGDDDSLLVRQILEPVANQQGHFVRLRLCVRIPLLRPGQQIDQAGLGIIVEWRIE